MEITKKTWSILCMVVLMICSMTIVSCGDDDESGDNQEQTDNGTGGSDAGGSDSYTWASIKGVWMESGTYGAHASTIETYKRENMKSAAYLNNLYDGDFYVSGYQFNASGKIRDVDVCTKIWHYENALILKTIYAPDQTVYWTDINTDGYSDRLTIRGYQIYHDGNARFKIINPTIIQETSSGTYYTKVQ